MGPAALAQVLRRLPPREPDPNLLVGSDTADDAGVYRIDAERAFARESRASRRAAVGRRLRPARAREDALPVYTATSPGAAHPHVTEIPLDAIAGTLETAVPAAYAAARATGSPVVLLSPACASFDQFTGFEARGEAFRALVSQLPTAEAA